MLFLTKLYGLEALVAHIDIDSQYNSSTQAWNWVLIADGVQKQPEHSYMPGRDLPAGSSSNRTGERHTRPTSGVWDFLGMAAREPVWIYTQLNNQYAWLGFHDTEAQFSVPQQVTLTAVEGPAGGHFSLYNSSSAVYFKTTDGITTADLFEKPLSHNHINWAFSKRGMWCVKLRVSGYLGPGLTNPTPVSQEVPLYFAIGQRAQWRANYYQHSNVMNEAVAGELADTDRDGVVNLLEYAFGGNPTIASQVSADHGGTLVPSVAIASVGAQRFLEIRFYRRTHSQPIEVGYEAQFSNSLHDADWQTQPMIQSVQSVDANWELVTVRDQEPISAQMKRFARVKVSAL